MNKVWIKHHKELSIFATEEVIFDILFKCFILALMDIFLKDNVWMLMTKIIPYKVAHPSHAAKTKNELSDL